MIAPAKPKSSVVDRQGRPIALGARLGGGGEGEVFEVRDHPGTVAKIYAQAVPPEKAAKIALMTRLQSEQLLKIAAWPVGSLYDGTGSTVVGLLMPRVEGHQEIHQLYSPKSRLGEFPHATWPFLIAAATNVARAFAAMHAAGQVIGDVNHANVVVSRQATVKLIDCDSFQISANGCRYPCDVGVPIFQPPEFQDLTTFRGVLRTPNHDNFGLAVLIFHLLFMGRHPFAGTYLGTSEMPIEQAIKEFRFAYGSGALPRRMKQPPNTLPLRAVSPPVSSLFERAFAPEGARVRGRPSALEWIDALGRLAGQLTVCPRNPAHGFWSSLSACPWCAIEDRTGIHLFAARAVARVPADAFDVEAVWAEINAVTSPGSAPALPSWQSLPVQPSTNAARFRQRRRAQVAAGIVVGVLGGAAWVSGVPVHGAAAVWSFLVAASAGWGVASHGVATTRDEARRQRDAARARWSEVENRWKREAGDQPFRAKLRELAIARDDYLALPARRQKMLQRLQSDRRERQLHRFLDRHRLADAQIPGIGPGREATLRSYGVETADDVTRAAVLRVPGFGPTLAGALLTWRRELERKFVFDPTRAVDPRDLEDAEHSILADKARLEQKLLGGAAELRAIAQQTIARRASLRPEVEQALTALAQAEADAVAVG
jgi:DNA-binding helix-hairpin-helix protein with protein kinase domain